ncbi:MAG: hypothetical protein R2824_18795 [Saprospiraceae bacterium]|nr:hypothetical protein [Lewinella sp.]
MPAQITYQLLFDLKLWHEYWLIDNVVSDSSPAYYRLSDFLEIVPTDRCRQILKKYRWIFKNTQMGASIHCPVDRRVDPAPTYVRVEERIQLDFILKVKDPYFSNYSNLPAALESGHFMYFDNRSGATAGANNDILFLSRPLASYDQGADYSVGDLVRHNGLAYEVIDIPIQNEPGSNGQSEWAKSADSQYVSSGDFLLFPGLNLEYSDQKGLITPGTQGTFEIRNIYGEISPLGFKAIPVEPPLNPIPFEKFSHPASTTTVFTHNMPLINIPDGYYELVADSWEGQAFFRLDTRAYPGMIGLISILHIPEGDAASSMIEDGFKILDENSVPNRRRFNIHFKSRMTRWKYFKTGSGPPKLVHTETRPRSFLRVSDPLEITIDGNQKAVPNPTVRSLDIEDQGNGKKRYYSKIYI